MEKMIRFTTKCGFVIFFGFIVNLFGGGHPEGAGTDQTFPTGNWYRCFANNWKNL